MFAQISVKQGIKQFKEHSVSDIFKEYKNIYDMNKFGIVCPEDLTTKHERDALCAITLNKEKRSETIKGRACADGIAQTV